MLIGAFLNSCKTLSRKATEQLSGAQLPTHFEEEERTNMADMNDTAEKKRLDEAGAKGIPWRRWGPYLSERQWGTVREDYSDNRDAWGYFSHDQARSRAYHWGEDRIAGISDDKQRLRVLSRRQRRRAWSESSNRMDWTGSRTDPVLRIRQSGAHVKGGKAFGIQ
jgi:hypothetical protein